MFVVNGVSTRYDLSYGRERIAFIFTFIWSCFLRDFSRSSIEHE